MSADENTPEDLAVARECMRLLRLRLDGKIGQEELEAKVSEVTAQGFAEESSKVLDK